MKSINSCKNWQQSITVTPLVSLAVTAVATASNAPNKAQYYKIKLTSPEQILFKQENEFLRAQERVNCRRVVTRGSHLNVRSSPGGAIIGSLPNRTVVTLDGQLTKGWVRISSPVIGYVSADYLKLCAEPAPPSTIMASSRNVRRVAAREGIYVRQFPSMNSHIIGSLANEQRVIIVNPGINGWVPISSPLKGYVSSAYLKDDR